MLRHKIILIQWILFVNLFFLPLATFAQEVRATVRVDSNAILIGDWLNVYLEVQHPGNINLGTPQPADSLRGLEVVKQEPPVLTTTNNLTIEKITITITAFDSGSYQFPSINVPYSVAGDSMRKMATTLPITIIVHGVVVDTSLGIKDIKPPLSLPLTFAEMLPYLLGTIGLGIVVWLIYYILKKRKNGESIIPSAPPRPAHEVALEELSALEAEHLWQRGKIKEFQSRVTEIVRQYIEKRFHVMALEQTTDEILTSEAIKLLPDDGRSHLKTMLVRADLVKFAKFQPQPEEHETSLASARTFIQSTTEDVKESGREIVSEEVKA